MRKTLFGTLRWARLLLRLNVLDEILKVVDLNKVIERIEWGIILEYNLRKLQGKFEGKNLSRLLEEVEEEWRI